MRRFDVYFIWLCGWTSHKQFTFRTSRRASHVIYGDVLCVRLIYAHLMFVCVFEVDTNKLLRSWRSRWRWKTTKPHSATLPPEIVDYYNQRNPEQGDTRCVEQRVIECVRRISVCKYDTSRVVGSQKAEILLKSTWIEEAYNEHILEQWTCTVWHCRRGFYVLRDLRDLTLYF